MKRKGKKLAVSVRQNRQAEFIVAPLETEEVDSAGVLLLPFSQCEQELNLPGRCARYIREMRFNEPEASFPAINRAAARRNTEIRARFPYLDVARKGVKALPADMNSPLMRRQQQQQPANEQRAKAYGIPRGLRRLRGPMTTRGVFFRCVIHDEERKNAHYPRIVAALWSIVRPLEPPPLSRFAPGFLLSAALRRGFRDSRCLPPVFAAIGDVASVFSEQ